MDVPRTLQQAIEFFANPQNCHDVMVAQRWPNGIVTCPTCGRENPSYLAKQARFQCFNKHPKRQFSVKVGTIFEDSPIPLKSWLLATWMIVNCKNGISSAELARALGVTQKTAWFMNHRIRLSMQDADGGKLGGEVEVDETYIGGHARNMHHDKREKMKGRTWHGKVAVMGLLERNEQKGKSRVRTSVVRNTRRSQLHPQLDKHLTDGPETTVFTDSLHSYRDLNNWYTHHVINHAERYAIGVIHTNGMENYWSLLKRSITGTYVSVEPFHLFRYLDEQSFRFNNRASNDSERFQLALKQVTGRRVTYEALTGEAGSI
jgi:transposase-like protein